MKKRKNKKKKAIWLIVCLSVVGLLALSFIVALISAGTDSQTTETKMYSERAMSGDEELGVGEIVDKKVIKTGNLDLVVKKAGEAVVRITGIAIEKEGFVADSNVYTREDKSQYGTITIRVPVERFEETMSEIKNIAELVEEESISGRDVTEEFIDLQSRLKNLRIEEEQYQKIVQRALKIEDVLNATKHLFQTREEIERMEGRIKYLENLTDLSTITAYLSEEPRIEGPAFTWKPLNVIKRALRSMIKFWQTIANILIWLIIFLIPIAIIVFLAYIIIKRTRKK